MAYLALMGKGTDWVQLRVEGLQYSANEYSIYIRNLTLGTGSSDLGWGTNNYSDAWLETGLVSGATYDYEAEVIFNGTSYYFPKTVTTDSPPPKVRPSNWSWTYAKSSGVAFNLTASEWNSFTSRINSFRDYKNMSAYSFTSAVSGSAFTASMFNEARSAIAGMNTSGLTSSVSSGSVVYASYLNNLRDVLNGIT